jgi:hypothetical protein
MDFTLLTLGSSISHALASSYPALMSKRRQLAPPSSDTLPRQPFGRDAKDTRCTAASSTFFDKCNKTALHKFNKDEEDDDDETASTVSYSTSTDLSLEEDEEDEVDFLVQQQQPRKSVSFCYPVVTQVRTRPRTTQQDKYYLHYSDVDYLDFKIGFVTGKDRTRKVSFEREVVSSIASIPAVPCHEKEKFYYSEAELQHFLDEFVKSLDQRL